MLENWLAIDMSTTSLVDLLKYRRTLHHSSFYRSKYCIEIVAVSCLNGFRPSRSDAYLLSHSVFRNAEAISHLDGLLVYLVYLDILGA